MKPWGIIHNGCCGLKKFKSEPEEVLAWEDSSNPEDINRRVEALEKFRDFLSGNVVDTSLLKRGSKRSRRGKKSRRNNINNISNNSINSSNDSITDSNDSIIEIKVYDK